MTRECGAISEEFAPNVRFRCVLAAGHHGDHLGDTLLVVTDQNDLRELQERAAAGLTGEATDV